MNKIKFIAITLLLLSFGLVGTSAIARPDGTISVEGSANLDLQPDVAEFNVIITTKDKQSLENASIANKEISANIYKDLNTMLDKANGDYIKTINYSANPVYYYSNGKQVFDKFEVTNTITVHTKKLTDVGMLIDKSLSLGATNIGNINFKLEDHNSFCTELLTIATKKAKAKAENVAKAAGQKITGVHAIHTSCNVNNYSPMPRYVNMSAKVMYAATEDAVAGNGTQLQSGAIKLYANVNADFYAK